MGVAREKQQNLAGLQFIIVRPTHTEDRPPSAGRLRAACFTAALRVRAASGRPPSVRFLRAVPWPGRSPAAGRGTARLPRSLRLSAASGGAPAESSGKPPGSPARQRRTDGVRAAVCLLSWAAGKRAVRRRSGCQDRRRDDKSAGPPLDACFMRQEKAGLLPSAFWEGPKRHSAGTRPLRACKKPADSLLRRTPLLSERVCAVSVRLLCRFCGVSVLRPAAKRTGCTSVRRRLATAASGQHPAAA